MVGLSTRGYYKWLTQPVLAREAENIKLISLLHDGDPEGGYQVLR